MGPDGDVDHTSDDEFVSDKNTNPTVRFSEAGYYRVKTVFLERGGWAGFRLSWKVPGAESFENIPERSLFSAPPGLAVPVTMTTRGGVPTVPRCEAGGVASFSAAPVATEGLGGVRVRLLPCRAISPLAWFRVARSRANRRMCP